MLIGQTLGPYVVVSKLGEGGMGEVYRALDTTLGRQVAIKCLPEIFSDDPDRSARFEREAKMLAAVNHPNIAQIYGFEKADGVQALVMELVDGPTLADRIAQGPLPVDEMLPIARQIVEALEGAHEQGIVHRDLKPANIKLRPDGTVKVLDFGLAKAFEQTPAGGSNALAAPTITSPALLTGAGMLLGTAAYMSPEQARGKPVDRRTDIWAFGCVLYEMLTARRAFDGEDVSLTLSQVLQREPALDAMPGDVPPRLRKTVHLCLRKSLKERVPDIGTVRLMLDGAFDAVAGQTTTSVVSAQSTWQRTVPFVLTAVAGAVIASLAIWQLMPARSSGAPNVVRFAVPSSADVAPRGTGVGRHVLAMSPQGTHLVYWAGERLNVRALDGLDGGVAVRGTEGAREPFFSPDGQWIGFYNDGELKRVPLGGGAAIKLGSAQNPWGVSWGSDGVIRYGQGPEGIWQVPAGGGPPSRLIAIEKGEFAHGPQLLPGDDWVLFTFRPSSQDSWDNAQIVAQSPTSGERIVLIDRGRDARYLPTGHLVYGLNGVLLGVPFDVQTRRVTGQAVPLVEGVMDADIRTGAMHYSVSNDGTLAYLSGVSGNRSTLSWVHRDGRRELLPLDAQASSSARISPDGTRVAMEIAGRDGVDIHIFDVTRKTLTPLTSSPAHGRWPLWTPDSERVVFYSDAGGGGLYMIAADGTGSPRRITTTRASQRPYSWADGGQTLLFDERPPDRLSKADIYSVSLVGEPTVTALVHTEAIEAQPELSPHGRWLAYSAGDGTGVDVYVRPFPRVDDGRWRISTEGGDSPIWSRDGSELFFVSRARAMSVRIDTAPTFRASTPTVMFDLPPYYRSAARIGGREWDIAPDGRFLIMNPGESASNEAAVSQMVVVLNWHEELKRLAK